MVVSRFFGAADLWVVNRFLVILLAKCNRPWLTWPMPMRSLASKVLRKLQRSFFYLWFFFETSPTLMVFHLLIQHKKKAGFSWKSQVFIWGFPFRPHPWLWRRREAWASPMGSSTWSWKSCQGELLGFQLHLSRFCWFLPL